MDETLIENLQNPSLYPHPITGFEIIQTHLSWVILTGHYAYKIKKPLNLGFQDFTTLALRQKYCELELTLNKKLAPNLYLDVLAITGSKEKPQIVQKSSNAIEYAIKMHQFSQEKLFINQIKSKALANDLLMDIANQMAVFHQNANVSPKHQNYGNPQQVFAPIQDNFIALGDLSPSRTYQSSLSQIEHWATQQFQLYIPLLKLRKQQGFIKACHGDCHLENIVLYENRPLIFDCIEFNEQLRWIDVINDLAFLIMDLERFHQFGAANILFNHYLEHTCDYQGALLCDFYKSYRAMVRAKISAIQISQNNENSTLLLEKNLKTFIDLAIGYTESTRPKLSITFGLSGSGKTFCTSKMLNDKQVIRLRSDAIRKHLFKQPHQNQDIYSAHATKIVYEKLAALTQQLLSNNFNVIIDATCLKKWQRELFYQLAKNIHCEFQILTFDCPIETLQQRIATRQTQKNDLSEANSKVLEWQISQLEPLSDFEKQFVKPSKK